MVDCMVLYVEYLKIIRDNFAYSFIKTYVVGTFQNCPDEVILMSTHNISFYEELTKIIIQLSINTILII